MHPPSAPLGKRESTKARNRATLLAAARQVFAEHGIEAATTREIVRATDLSVGTFYQYFRDKEHVFEAVALEAVVDLRQRLHEVRMDGSLPFRERIRLGYLAFFRFVVEEQALYRVLERDLWQLPDHARRLATGRRGAPDPEPSPGGPTEAVAEAIVELAEDLRPAAGEAWPTMEDPETAAAAMTGVGLLVARRLATDPAPNPERAARFCTDFAFEGLPEQSTASGEETG